MNAVSDPRDPEQSTYSQAHLIWLGILLFIARRLAESLRNYPVPSELSLPGQVRFLPP